MTLLPDAGVLLPVILYRFGRVAGRYTPYCIGFDGLPIDICRIVLVDGVAGQYIYCINFERLIVLYRSSELPVDIVSVAGVACRYMSDAIAGRCLSTIDGVLDLVGRCLRCSAGFGARLLEYRSTELSDEYCCRRCYRLS